MGRPYVNYRPVTAALEHEQADELKQLSERTRVPQQVLLREAVADLLKKYRRRARRRG